MPRCDNCNRRYLFGKQHRASVWGDEGFSCNTLYVCRKCHKTPEKINFKNAPDKYVYGEVHASTKKRVDLDIALASYTIDRNALTLNDWDRAVRMRENNFELDEIAKYLNSLSTGARIPFEALSAAEEIITRQWIGENDPQAHLIDENTHYSLATNAITNLPATLELNKKVEVAKGGLFGSIIILELVENKGKIDCYLFTENRISGPTYVKFSERTSYVLDPQEFYDDDAIL